ncbi:transposase (plasmid) [Azospirillum sp. B510]|nr:transposase [Azospirillum sp. B510]
MALDRIVSRDDQWKRIAPLLPCKVGAPGRSAADNRLFLEAVLWIVRVVAPWRDLPAAFGNWNSVFQRYRRWAKAGVFDEVFAALSSDADFRYAIIDDPIVRVHQHGTGARGAQAQAIGRSRGGLTTKILAVVDALGNPDASPHDTTKLIQASPLPLTSSLPSW